MSYPKNSQPLFIKNEKSNYRYTSDYVRLLASKVMKKEMTLSELKYFGNGLSYAVKEYIEYNTINNYEN